MHRLLFPIFALTLFFSCAPNHPKNNSSHDEKVYKSALQMGDVNVAIHACYDIIANDSTKTNYYDTLVYLYLNTRNDGSTFLAARASLKYKPDNDKMTRVSADYAKALGMPDTAIFYYKKTFELNNKLENLYEVAQVQYNAGYDSAAEQTAEQIINTRDSEKMMIAIAAEQEKPQQIPLKAAAFNIKGTIFISMGNKEGALRYFNEALKLAPDFRVAKKNKEDIRSGKIKFQ